MCETPNLAIILYGDPPAKYHSAITSLTLDEISPLGMGGGPIYPMCLPWTVPANLSSLQQHHQFLFQINCTTAKKKCNSSNTHGESK